MGLLQSLLVGRDALMKTTDLIYNLLLNHSSELYCCNEIEGLWYCPMDSIIHALDVKCLIESKLRNGNISLRQKKSYTGEVWLDDRFKKKQFRKLYVAIDIPPKRRPRSNRIRSLSEEMGNDD